MRELLPGAEERDYARKPLTAPEVEEILAAAGNVAAVLNTTHATAKARGWKENPPTNAEFVPAAIAEPNLLRRPIVIKDGKAVVGVNVTGWKGLAG